MKKILLVFLVSIGLVACSSKSYVIENNSFDDNSSGPFVGMSIYSYDYKDSTTVQYIRGTTTSKFDFAGKKGEISYIVNTAEGHQQESAIQITGDYGDYTVNTKFSQYYTLVNQGIVYRTYDELINQFKLVFLDFNGWKEVVLSTFNFDLAMTDYFATVVQWNDFIVFTEPIGIDENGALINNVFSFNLSTGIKEKIFDNAIFLCKFNDAIFVLDLSSKEHQSLVKFSRDLQKIDDRIEVNKVNAVVTSSNDMLFYSKPAENGGEAFHFITPSKEVIVDYLSTKNSTVSGLEVSAGSSIDWVTINKDIALISTYENLEFNYYLYKFGYDFVIRFEGQYPFAFMLNGILTFTPDGNETRYEMTYDELNAQFEKIKESIK